MNRVFIITFAALFLGTQAFASTSIREAMQRFTGKYLSLEGSAQACHDLSLEIEFNYSDARKGNKRLIISKLQTGAGEFLSRKFLDNDISEDDLKIKYGIRNYGANAYIIFDYSNFNWVSGHTAILEFDLDEPREILKMKVSNSRWSLTKENFFTFKTNMKKDFECELKKI